MCHLCDLIDYPVADVWRPCWQPSHPPFKVKIPNEEDFEAAKIIQEQRQTIRGQQRRIDRLIANVESLRVQQKKTTEPPKGVD